MRIHLKYYFWISLTSLLIFLFLVACAGTPTGQNSSSATLTYSGNQVRVATDGTLPPFTIQDMGGQIWTGFDIDIINAIGGQAGFIPVFTRLPTAQLVEAISVCQYDLAVSAIGVNPHSSQWMDFSTPYLVTRLVVIVKQGNLVIQGRDSLLSQVAGVEAYTQSAILLTEDSLAEVRLYSSIDAAFNDLISGYIDAVVTDEIRAAAYVNNQSYKLKIVGDPFGEVQYAVAVCKQKTELLEKVNASLVALQAKGSIQKLVKKWKINP